MLISVSQVGGDLNFSVQSGQLPHYQVRHVNALVIFRPIHSRLDLLWVGLDPLELMARTMNN